MEKEEMDNKIIVRDVIRAKEDEIHYMVSNGRVGREHEGSSYIVSGR